MFTLLAEFINLYKKRFVLVSLLAGMFLAVFIFFITASFNQIASTLIKIKANKTPEAQNLTNTISFTDSSENTYELVSNEINIAGETEDKTRFQAIQKTKHKAQKIANWLNLKLGNIVGYHESVDTSVPFKIKVTVTLTYELLR